MRGINRFIACAVCVVILSFLPLTAKEGLLHITGDYLAFSYDFNQLYGEKVQFNFLSYTVTAQYIKIDLSSRAFYASGNILLKEGQKEIYGDELVFLPNEGKGLLINYNKMIAFTPFGDINMELLLENKKSIDSINVYKIRKSLFYFTGKDMDITEDLDVFGKNVTLFIEGFESFGLKKFKLSEGIKQIRSGFSIDRIWYNKTQGLIGRMSFVYQKKDKIDSLTQIDYEEHSILKNYQGLPRQVDLRTKNTVQINKTLIFGLDANYNSSSLWNTRLYLDKKWKDTNYVLVDFTYNKPINQRGETWFGVLSQFESKKLGTLTFSGRYEIHNQFLSELAYYKDLWKNVKFNFRSSYSKIQISGSSTFSEILTGGIDLSYSSRVFNLSTNYFLNSDLFGHQVLSQPQLRFGLTPFNLYNGLLTASIGNIFIWNSMKMDNVWQSNYSNNTVFKLTSKPIYFQKGLSLDFNIALEQFLEKEGRNFTSGGLIFNLKKTLVRGITLEGFYSFQSRRKTEGWLIEGTTSQDLSTVLRINPSNKLNGWISLSYDPKTDRFRQSFADISIGLVKNWKLHSLINYDFLLNKLNNIDLYLIREAGRFQIRFIWRSISRQILIELVPN
ncbi:MAG: hypothetical protein KAX11_01245 [Candidatus Aminicenantes bacterium]|nr:hypothetical protein [Candidatus Aminicenantes bacterium]